ncbi:hypothetical protein HN873_016944, partial [Arachis hypogaea]
AMIYFTGEVSGSSPGWPSCAKEKNRRLTPSCMLHLARGDIAQLVELRSCNWVVAITGWMSNCPGAPFEILRRVALWRAQYDESCKLCSGGSYCLSLASMFDLCYDLLFMDVDKILPSSSTLGWHSLQVKGEVQTRKGLWWIPRHPETRKGVVSNEMLRGVENKRRSGDSRIGQPFELLLNPRVGKRQPGQLKHLSSQRKRKQKRFP